MSKGHGFSHELRRRHVVRVAIACAGTAWVLLQLASIVFPTFGAPDWTLKIFIAALALGFPIALILAWTFELTPDVARRTEPAHSEDARPDEKTHRVSWKLDVAIGAVLAIVMLRLADRFFIRQTPSEADAAPAKSIAVLPFENLGKDEDNAIEAARSNAARTMRRQMGHLRQALALPTGVISSPASLRLDPVCDPIGDDPRFAQLLTLGEVPVEIATKP